jgi:glycosyltransferase involved in cell wall biosynthesis
MKKVLLVTDVNFWEKSSGNRMRIYNLIEWLAPLVQLTVVNTGPAPQNIETLLARKFEAEFFVLEKTKYLNSNGYGRRLKAFLKTKHFDAVIIEYIHSSYFLNFLIEETILILDAHDIISHRTYEFKKFNYSGSLYELPRETEIEIFSAYDHVLALCQPDFEEITAMVGPGRALLCPHPVQTCPHPLKESAKNIVFIASGYLPNVDAINWFIDNCWSHISAKYDVRLLVFGTVGGNIKLSGHQEIICKGFVEDLHQIYRDADIIINPVRFGAGLKIKNVEALSHGLPLVTTTHGARGIEAGISNAFLVADDHTEFIHSVESLIKDINLRKKLMKNAIKFINDNFSAERCFKPLFDVINF